MLFSVKYWVKISNHKSMAINCTNVTYATQLRVETTLWVAVLQTNTVNWLDWLIDMWVVQLFLKWQNFGTQSVLGLSWLHWACPGRALALLGVSWLYWACPGSTGPVSGVSWLMQESSVYNLLGVVTLRVEWRAVKHATFFRSVLMHNYRTLNTGDTSLAAVNEQSGYVYWERL